MEFSFSNVNYLAVLVAAISSFMVGGFWYSGLAFGKAWMTENNFTEEDLKGGNMAVIFGGAFALALIGALCMDMAMGAHTSWMGGLTMGLIIGFAWASATVGTHYLFERKSLRLWLIHSGRDLLTFGIMGAIIGAWN